MLDAQCTDTRTRNLTGHDLKSAKELAAALGQHFQEEVDQVEMAMSHCDLFRFLMNRVTESAAILPYFDRRCTELTITWENQGSTHRFIQSLICRLLAIRIKYLSILIQCQDFRWLQTPIHMQYLGQFKPSIHC